MSESDWLEDTARELARQYGEAALVVVCPPESAICGPTSQIPYCVLVSQASPEERDSPGARRFEP
jgi:hypothetical protein